MRAVFPLDARSLELARIRAARAMQRRDNPSIARVASSTRGARFLALVGVICMCLDAPRLPVRALHVGCALSDLRPARHAAWLGRRSFHMDLSRIRGACRGFFLTCCKPAPGPLATTTAQNERKPAAGLAGAAASRRIGGEGLGCDWLPMRPAKGAGMISSSWGGHAAVSYHAVPEQSAKPECSVVLSPGQGA